MSNDLFQVFDYVRYNGSKLGIKRDVIGEVVAHVEKSSALVCEFSGDSFIIDPQNLVHHVFKEKQDSFSIDKIVRKWAVPSDDEKPNKKKK